MKRNKIIAAAAAGVILVTTASCAVFDREDVFTNHPVYPELWVKHEPVPDTQRLYLKLHVYQNHVPRSFSLHMVLYQYFKGKAVPVAGWGRDKRDLPGPGESIWWELPDGLPPHNEGPLACADGSYYTRWRVRGVSATGQSYDETFFYPYNLAKKHYTAAPSARRSWKVKCSRAGRVKDPHGE